MNDAFKAEPSREDIVHALLQATNITVAPTVPTAIADYLNLEIDYFKDHVKYKIDKRIKAFLWPQERIIGVYQKLTKPQIAFSIFHEIGHFVLPGHVTHPNLIKADGKIVDDSKRLNSSDPLLKTDIALVEIEANQFAADCLFQVDRFDRFVHPQELNWLNIRLAASRYGASIEAAARRWIERSEKPCAMIVFSPQDRTNLASLLEIKYTITSKSFALAYFSRLGGQPLSETSMVHRFFHGLEYYGDDPIDTLNVQMAGGKIIEFPMMLFSNSYRVFGLVTPPK